MVGTALPGAPVEGQVGTAAPDFGSAHDTITGSHTSLTGVREAVTGVHDAVSGMPTGTSGARLVAVVLGAIVVLAGLDFVGAVVAKEWSDTHNPRLFVAGVLLFAVLFAVYAAILQVAELSVVTMGWIAVLQVSLLVVDRVRYDLHLSVGQWSAVGIILVLQMYLVLTSAGRQGA